MFDQIFERAQLFRRPPKQVQVDTTQSLMALCVLHCSPREATLQGTASDQVKSISDGLQSRGLEHAIHDASSLVAADALQLVQTTAVVVILFSSDNFARLVPLLQSFMENHAVLVPVYYDPTGCEPRLDVTGLKRDAPVEVHGFFDAEIMLFRGLLHFETDAMCAEITRRIVHQSITEHELPVHGSHEASEPIVLSPGEPFVMDDITGHLDDDADSGDGGGGGSSVLNPVFALKPH